MAKFEEKPNCCVAIFEPRKKVQGTVPPEGKWGWCVVFAYIITGMTIIPIIQNFGLIFKKRLLDINFSSTDITTIISMNSSIGQILGIFQGPLLKKFGYRKMAAFGVTCFTAGTFLSGFANSFATFLITYGIVTSVGFTYTLTSFSIAVNSYFKKSRSRISGWLMGFTGLGPVFMPQVVTFFLGTYGTLGTSFMLAALTAQSFIGVCLLQPVKWHLELEEPDKDKLKGKPVDGACGEKELSAEFNVDGESLVLFGAKRERALTVRKTVRSVSESHDDTLYTDNDIQTALDTEDEPLKPRRSLNDRYDADVAMSSIDLMNKLPIAYASVETLGSINHYSLGRQDSTDEDKDEDDDVDDDEEVSMQIDTPPVKKENQSNLSSGKSFDSIHTFKDDDSNETTIPKASSVIKMMKKKRTMWQRLARWFAKQFDLDLFNDLQYISITVGMSIAVIGELMFSILTPFILYEVGLDLQMAATFMSVTGISDIVARFTSPYIAEVIKIKSPRVMYVTALFLLLITRASMLFIRDTVGLIFVAAAVGFAKGVRTVFWGLVLPHYVPIEKLGSAMSFQNLINGIFICVAGPLSGLIVEINNSYLNIIYVSNAMTAATILLWSGEYLYRKCTSNGKTTKSEPVKNHQ